MDLHEENNAAEEVRKTVRKKRLERSRCPGKSLEAAPVAVGDLPEEILDAAPVAVGDLPEKFLEAAPVALGTLSPIPHDEQTLWPMEQWGNPLKLVLADTSFIDYGLNQTLTYNVNGSPFSITTLNSPSDTELEIDPKLIEWAGRYSFDYVFTDEYSNSAESQILRITVDKVPPNGGLIDAAPALPDDVVLNGLTLRYLNTHPFLDITVPRTNDILVGDTVFISWVPSRVASRWKDPYASVASKEITVEDLDLNKDGPVVSINSDDVKKLAQGKIEIRQFYKDRTGNFGAYSLPIYVHVDFTPDPDKLQSPIVDLAMDGLIDRADALLGVEVEIPAPTYENSKPEDEIQVIWEGTRLPPVPVSNFPMVIRIDWVTLSLKGDDTTRDVEVSYEVIRKGWATPSPKITVKVFFAVAGPPPEGLDPVNTKLPLVVVRSRDSNAPDNELGAADVGLAATAQLPLYDEVTRGQVLRLYWGTLIEPVSEIVIEDQVGGDIVEFSIAWEDIVKGGYNEAQPAHYKTWNGVNEQESLPTYVSVTIVPVEGLVDVEFPGRWLGNPGPVPVINCDSKPWEGIDVLMPGGTAGMQAGETVTFSWLGFSDTAGTNPIPGTALTFDSITVTPEHVEDGIEFKIPYADRVEPIIKGSGMFTYTLLKTNGQEGIHSTRVIITRKQGSDVCSAIPRAAGRPGEKGRPPAGLSSHRQNCLIKQ